ncbi:MAG: M20/M25/M40 family metallo-hydrolase [Planctomycetes bacterium]|nr:M20/M25/M40 family metallo-hydrolase [Planctomycetota bacterium]
MPPRAVTSRLALSAATGGLCLLLANFTAAAPLEVAPAPRPSASETDRAIMAEIKARAEIMKNLEHLSDRIGGRLTGSANLERANRWTAEKMKAYGLENVRLEPWEIPYGWERGPAGMKLVEPNTGHALTIASAGWAPGTKGKVTGDVVVLNVKTKAELQAYKGKLKNAVVLRRPPSKVAPITDLNYPGGPEKKGEAKKDEPKKDAGERPPAKGDNKAPDAKEQPKDQPPRKGGFGFDMQFQNEVRDFLKAEGAACVVSDSGKPHGLLVTTGGWGRGDRAAAEEGIASVFMAHEDYAMLYRLASREKEPTRVEVEIRNTFVPGPITVYNTIGEVRGSEKPDEVVVVGAHLDSWELATGTTDNGTGTCVVLETARTIAALAKAGQRPKRTIRFCLFTGEEQGLHGSRKYVEKYKDDLPKHSVALVHDTGTGKVTGFGLEGRENVREIMEKELAGLKDVEGWKGLTRGGIGGGTDHFPFHRAGVPGFACNQDIDEYRLTHHTQSDTFDKAKEPNLIQGAQVLAVTAVRVANLPDLLPRK